MASSDRVLWRMYSNSKRRPLQRRLALGGPDAGFLVDAEDDRVLWRVLVDGRDRVDLVAEGGIGAVQPHLHSVGCKAFCPRVRQTLLRLIGTTDCPAWASVLTVQSISSRP